MLTEEILTEKQAAPLLDCFKKCPHAKGDENNIIKYQDYNYYHSIENKEPYYISATDFWKLSEPNPFIVGTLLTESYRK